MASQANQNSVITLSHFPPRKKIVNPCLPEDIIENILSYLSLKEICRLSVLSRRFRYCWKFCRDISFDSNFGTNLTKEECRNSINNFFMNRNSADLADTFKLYYDASAETNLVSSWIRKAVSLKVTELELDFTPSSKKFTLSYDLVNVETIRTMKLVNCELHLPFEANGLRCLTEITLQDVKARAGLIHSILLNCVSLRALALIKCSSIFSLMISGKAPLQRLVMKDCSEVHSVVVNTPSLSSFHYHGKITVFNFYCGLPNLSDVVFDIAHPRTFQMLSNRTEMMRKLGGVETLTVSSTFLEGLSARFSDNKFKDMAFLLLRLKEFHLIVAPESFVNPSDVAIFLRKCPYIERIFIDIGKNAFGRSYHWESFGKRYLMECNIVYPFLEHVKIKGFTGVQELPVLMAKYFLKNATNLTTLVLVKARSHFFPDFYTKECLRLGLLSKARIQVYDYNRDGGSVMPTHLAHV